jgi:DNA-binding NarL/FixJ family response regulator
LTEPIRVLIADDHAVMRRGLRLFLDLQEDLEVVGEAEDGGRAAEEAAAQRADVIVMDLSMPGLDGIHGTKLIQDGSPGSKVLLLSSFVDERVLPALNAGADGYLTKDTPPDELAAAIRSAYLGELDLDTLGRRASSRHAGAGPKEP